MKTLFCLLVLMVGCGGSSGSYKDPTPTPPPIPTPRPGSFAVAKVVIDEQCAVSGCHAGAAFTQNGAAFKASSARQRINSGSMPKRSGPNYELYNRTKKAILLNYLSN